MEQSILCIEVQEKLLQNSDIFSFFFSLLPPRPPPSLAQSYVFMTSNAKAWFKNVLRETDAEHTLKKTGYRLL